MHRDEDPCADRHGQRDRLGGVEVAEDAGILARLVTPVDRQERHPDAVGSQFVGEPAPEDRVARVIHGHIPKIHET